MSGSFGPQQITPLVEAYFNDSPGSSHPSIPLIVEGLLSGTQQATRDLVEILGPQLTATDVAMRSKGMALLSSVVAAVGIKLGSRPNGTTTSPTETKYEGEMIVTFSEFFIMRLEDTATMVESLEALHGLICSGRVPRRLCEQVLRRLFCDDSLHLQSSPQLIRRGAYWVLKSALEDEIGGGNAAVRHLGEELVRGFIQAMDGEKEPRNLLVALLVFPRLCWLVPEHVAYQEDLFEISSCYFPVSFSERADDLNAIRKTSLVNALRNTLCTGTEFWIPFLIEKLGSSLIETKLEVLQSLHHALTWRISITPSNVNAATSAFSLYTPLSSASIESLFKPFNIPQLGSIFWRFDQVQTSISAIAAALIREVMNTTDEQVAHSATTVLTDLTTFLKLASNGSLSSLPAPESRLQALRELIETMFKLCLTHFGLSLDPKSNVKPSAPSIDSKLSAMAAKILHAITCGSEEAAHTVLKRLVPLLEAKWLQAPAERSFVLRQLLNLTKATSLFDHASDSAPEAFAVSRSGSQVPAGTSSPPVPSHPLADYILPIVQIMQSCCMETASHAQDQADAMEGLAIAATLANGSLVSNSMLSQIVTTFNSKIIEHSHMDSTSVASVGLKVAALKALVKFYHTHTTITSETHPLDSLFAELHVRVAKVKSTPDDASYGELSAFVASLHAICDPSTLAAASEEDSPSLPAQVPPANPEILFHIQQELLNTLKDFTSDARVFSIFLSSLSRTATSLNVFESIFHLIAQHVASTEQTTPEWNQAVKKWFPVLTQRIVTSCLPTSQEQSEFLHLLHNIFINKQFSVIQPKGSDKPITWTPTAQENFTILCLSGLYAAVVTHPLTTLINKDDPSLQSESADAQSLAARLLNTLHHLFSQLSTCAASGNTQACSSHKHAAGGCGGSHDSPHAAEERSLFEWQVEALGSLLNKISHPSAVLDFFVQEKIISELLDHLEESQPNTYKAKVSILLTVTKALGQRNHPKGFALVTSLVSIIGNSTNTPLKYEVAEQMAALLEPRPRSLPNTTLLYRQKCWNQFIPLLKNQYSSAEAEQQSIIMLTLSGLLRHLPFGVLLQSVSTLLPILLQGLKRYGESVHEASVESLLTMMNTSPDVLETLESHLSSIVEPLVAIASSASPKTKNSFVATTPDPSQRPSTPSSAQTRMAAIQCLKLILKMPYAKIFPHRNTVVDGLLPALDDPKRNVRRQVVATRNEWFLCTKLK